MPKLNIDFLKSTYRDIMEGIKSSLSPLSHMEYSVVREDVNDDHIHAKVSLVRQDGTKYLESTLHKSEGSSVYTYRVAIEYGEDGTTVVSTNTYDLVYSESGRFTREILRREE